MLKKVWCMVLVLAVSAYASSVGVVVYDDFSGTAGTQPNSGVWTIFGINNGTYVSPSLDGAGNLNFHKIPDLNWPNAPYIQSNSEAWPDAGLSVVARTSQLTTVSQAWNVFNGIGFCNGNRILLTENSIGSGSRTYVLVQFWSWDTSILPNVNEFIDIGPGEWMTGGHALELGFNNDVANPLTWAKVDGVVVWSSTEPKYNWACQFPSLGAKFFACSGCNYSGGVPDYPTPSGVIADAKLEIIRLSSLHATGHAFTPIKTMTSVNPVIDTGYSENPVQKFFSIDTDTTTLYSYSTYTDANKMDTLVSSDCWIRAALNENGGWNVPNYTSNGTYARIVTPSYELWSPVWTFIAPQDGQYKLSGSIYAQPDQWNNLTFNPQRCEVYSFTLAERPYTSIDNITILDNSTYKLTTRTLAMHRGDMLCVAGINPHPDVACGRCEFYLNGGPDTNHAGNMSLTLAYYMYCPTDNATGNPMSDPFPGGTGSVSEKFMAFKGVGIPHTYAGYYDSSTNLMSSLYSTTTPYYRYKNATNYTGIRYCFDNSPMNSQAYLESPAIGYADRGTAVWGFVAPRQGRYKLEGKVYIQNNNETAGYQQVFEAFTFTGANHATFTLLDNYTGTSSVRSLPIRILDLQVGDMICVAVCNRSATGSTAQGGGKVYLKKGPSGKQGDLRITYLGNDDNSSARTVAQEITAEALRPNDDPIGKPLPLAATWNVSVHSSFPGWTPAYQISQIDAGHYIMPSFDFPWNNATINDQTRFTYGGLYSDYFNTALANAESRNLPITLVSSEWDGDLTYSSRPYLNAPKSDNPNVFDHITDTVKIDNNHGWLDPMGPIAPWKDRGYTWTANSPIWASLASIYPDPPLVEILSNNEAGKLTWSGVNGTPGPNVSRRYTDAYGYGTTDEFKRTVVGNGWISRYQGMQTSLLAGLNTLSPWSNKSFFTAYGAFGPNYFRRWPSWANYAIPIANRIDPHPLYWDGGSPNYYASEGGDYKVMSMQVQCQNWVFMLDEALKLNPDFWFELSIWDGNAGGSSYGVESYLLAGQTYPPDRYKGWVQFGMWTLRPRVVREFRNWLELLDCNGPEGTYPYTNTGYTNEQFFLALCSAVDRVHTSPTLRSFWRQGTLVRNTSETHPYQDSSYVPTGYDDTTINSKTGRWFMLTCSANPARGTWTLDTQLNVYAVSLVKGVAPNRQWLVYAHSPLTNTATSITVPTWGTISNVTVPRAGAFWICTEGNSTPQLVTD